MVVPVQVVPVNPDSRKQTVRSYASRLWATGLATSVVAALVAIAGAAVSGAVLDVPLLPAEYAGILGWSASASYGAGAFVLALVLTAMLHVLLAAVPQPVMFFEWIVGLTGVVFVVAPFGYDASRPSQIATSVVSALVMVAIGSLLGSQGALIERGIAVQRADAMVQGGAQGAVR